MADNIGYNTRSRAGAGVGDNQQFVDQQPVQDTGNYQSQGFGDNLQQGQTYGTDNTAETGYYGSNDNTHGMGDTSYAGNTDTYNSGNAYGGAGATTGTVTDRLGGNNTAGTTGGNTAYSSDAYGGNAPTTAGLDEGYTGNQATGGNIDQPYHQGDNAHHNPSLADKVEGMLEKLADKISSGHGHGTSGNH
ncbi:uncharacterized protein B0P05DRAFT_561041 [Gilbertella persicaria]|uniref:Uncharacterized protein n=1 Tax=Rhizopus stolonifer TaxID=4846 RepID=A0A367K7P0_RHIST|nr:uncharacterized protein B0P05DRAFT_561041 [Gilbertella persicaria]KAI8054146.1 hypothetical protein B0P05DRAFT_561041 [Gilbertella persicaria]RCH98187.1 hypothetical protein CU098_008735 [Rhizopus stolonifer]